MNKIMYNTGLIKFRKIGDEKGYLTPIEGNKEIPFDIKRIYYIYGVDKEITRGFHTHRCLHQILLCLNGSVKVKLKAFNEEEVIELNDPSIGLYIGAMVWREMFDFTDGAVLLVLASGYYDESDYIRDYDLFINESKKYSV